ncbi:MAG: hypothetical protein ACYTGR_15870 [Planctomycetota bacterium]|jgi:hypothetical protein
MTRTRVAAAFLGAAVMGMTGCLVTVKHKTDVTGTPISNSTLSQIVVGETTESWLVAVMGPPTSSTVVSGSMPAPEPEPESDAESEPESEADVVAIEPEPQPETEPEVEATVQAESGTAAGATPVEADPAPDAVAEPLVRILRWDYSRSRNQRGTVFLLLKTNSTSRESMSVRAEITDGIVTRYWVEEG